MRRLIVSALVAFVLVGPSLRSASAADREHQQMMADLRMLQLQTQELQLLLTSLTDALGRVTSKVDEQTAINRKAFADSRLLVDTVGGGIRILREKVDDTNVRIASFSQEIEALRMSIPRMPVQIIDPTTQAADAGEVPAGSPALLPVAPPAAVNPGISPQRLYDNAWADYTTGQWALAITGFDTYITAYPRSALADDAQFYIGQTYYNDGRFEDAVAAFDEVILNYPDGNAAPEAYYKRGLSLDRLGETDRALESFETVIANYPDSPMATMATQALDRLNRPAR